jgi:glycosyltransferase involved in cell wall biosynthesis
MKKKKIAFIKFGGMCSGGTEKHLQTLAVHLPKDKFDVTYFYCDAAPYIGSTFKHLDTDPYRLAYMESSDVKLVKFNVTAKNVGIRTHDWVGTDFWQYFDENDFDIIQTGRSGHPEYPFTLINNTPIVDSIHLAGMAERKQNVRKVVLVAEEQRQRWIRAGGEAEKSVVIPPALDIPDVDGDLREELGISENVIVFGMHQRPDDGIFSDFLMSAFSESIALGTYPDEVCLVVLGGSSLYKKHAEELGLDNVIFLPATGDVVRIHKFLNTLDLYTHARKDGEQCSSSIIEALSHGLPIVSHNAPSMGHSAQIYDAGFVCPDVKNYAACLSGLRDVGGRQILSGFARRRYEEKFSLSAIVSSYVKIYDTIETKA